MNGVSEKAKNKGGRPVTKAHATVDFAVRISDDLVDRIEETGSKKSAYIEDVLRQHFAALDAGHLGLGVIIGDKVYKISL